MLTIDSIPSELLIELHFNKSINKSVVCKVKPSKEKVSFLVKVRDVVIYETAFLETAISIYNKIESKKSIADFLNSPHRTNWELFFDNNVYFTLSFENDCYTYWKDKYTNLRNKYKTFDTDSWKESLSDFVKRVSVLFV